MNNETGDSTIGIPADVPRGLQSKQGLIDPFEWYDEKRSNASVQYDEHRGVYDVFRYDAVKRILHSPDQFVRPNLSPNGTDGDDPLAYIERAMVWSDEPGHDRAKQNMFEHFAPAQLESLRPSIERLTESELQEALETGESFDFVTDFAIPVTLKTPMKLLGVPLRDYQQIVQWIETFEHVSVSEHSDIGSHSPERMREAVEYFDELLETKARNPQDDLLSLLIHETPIERQYIGANCFDILFAGQGTMTDFLSNAIYLQTQKEIFDSAEADGIDLILEEVLRYRSPIQCQSRLTTEPVEVGNSRIPSGETVVLWLGSANRDPERFENPAQFESDRNPDHLAFGHGSHSCIGFSLARLEASVMLDTFFELCGSVDLLDDGVVPAPTPQVLSFEQLPVVIENA